MADVLLTSTEEVIQLVSVSGASQGDITSAVNAHSALTTGVHGVGASIVASAATVSASVSAHNALATAHGVASGFWPAAAGAASPSAENVLATMADIGSTFSPATGYNWTAGQNFQANVTAGVHGTTDAVIKLNQAEAEHDADHWINVNSTADFSGHHDPVLLIGYNCGSANIGVIRTVLDEGSMHVGIEGYYYYSPTQIYGEWYVQGITIDGTKRYRPFQSTFNYIDGLNENFIDAETTYFFDSSGTTLRMKLESSGLTLNNSMLIDGSANAVQLTVQGNATQTVNILEVQDSGGGAVFGIDKLGRIGAGIGVATTASITSSLTYTTSNTSSVKSIDLYVYRNDPLGSNNLYGMSQSVQGNADTVDSHIDQQYGLVTGMKYAASSGKTLSVDAGGGILINTPQVLGVGTKAITTNAGVLIQNQAATGVTNAYGIYIATQSGAATTNTPIYVQSGTVEIDGSLGMGIKTALDPIQIHTADPGSADKIAFSLGGAGFGNTVGGAESIAWRYIGGATVLGKMQGIVVSGGMELVFYTYISSLGERLRIGSTTITAQTDINVANTKVYKVNSVQVVGAQGAAVADATGAGDVVAQLNALLARCRAHGLIAT